MKLSPMLAIALSILLFACVKVEQPELTTMTTREANEVINQWLVLWESYKLEMVGEIFWNDPSLTYFSSEKRGLIKGFDKMEPHHQEFGFVMGGKTPSKSLWLEEVNITIHQGFAVVEGIWYFGDRSIAKEEVQNGPVTFVIIKNGEGKAKIAHTHFGNYE